MEFFSKAKSVRLRSHLDKYLVAEDDEETVRQSRTGSSRKARWLVELVPGKANVIRLKGCHGRYLTASGDSFLLGWTGKKVVQTLPTTKMDASTEWQPITDGFQVKLRANGGKFLRANGGTPPWKDSITHDVPQRTVTQDWVLWSVDIVDIAEFDIPANYISPASSFSSIPDDFSRSDTGSPAIGSRRASNRQIHAQQEDGNERSKPQMDHVENAYDEETKFMTPSKPREKTFDEVCKIPVDQEAIKERSNDDEVFDETKSEPRERNSKPFDETDYTPPKLRDQTHDLDPSPKIPVEQEAIKGFDQTINFNSSTPRKRNSKPSYQTDYTPSKLRDQTNDLDQSPKAPDIVPSSPNFNSSTPRKRNSKPSYQTDYTPSKLRDQTNDLDQSPKASDIVPSTPNFNSSTPRKRNSKPSYQTDYTPSKLGEQTYDLDESPKASYTVPSTIPTPMSSPSEKTTASMPRKSSTPMDDHLNLVFSELESIVSDVGSRSTSFSEPRMEDEEASEMSATPSKEEIRQALAALKECLVLEFSQLKQARVKAKFILALSTLSIAKGSLSQEQMEACQYFLSNFNAIMIKFDRAERQLAEFNNFLRDKNRAYDDLRVIKETNLDLKARIDQLDEEEEELLRKIEEIRGMKTKLVNKRMELGEDSKSALEKWNEFVHHEPTVLSRQKKFEKRRDEIVEDWSNLKVLFD